MVDMIVPRAELRATLARLLRLYAVDGRLGIPALDHTIAIEA
jgi:hypothetical protein